MNIPQKLHGWGTKRVKMEFRDVVINAIKERAPSFCHVTYPSGPSGTPNDSTILISMSYENIHWGILSVHFNLHNNIFWCNLAYHHIKDDKYVNIGSTDMGNVHKEDEFNLVIDDIINTIEMRTFIAISNEDYKCED